MYSIRKMIDDVYRYTIGESVFDFYICKGNFLDEFYYLKDLKIRQSMIDEEPKFYKNIDKWIYAYTASMCHKLANDYNLSVPKWVFNRDIYYLKDPYFGDNVTYSKLRLYLMYTSPSEFKHRNVFTSSNTLYRV